MLFINAKKLFIVSFRKVLHQSELNKVIFDCLIVSIREKVYLA